MALAPANQHGKRLRKRYGRNRSHLFTFLDHPDAPPDNNGSERELRPTATYRKVTGGFRSNWGADLFAAVRSVVGTAARHGADAYQAIHAILARRIGYKDRSHMLSWIVSESVGVGKAQMMKKVLVCGAGGFIGGHLVKLLKNEGCWGPRDRSEASGIFEDGCRRFHDRRPARPRCLPRRGGHPLRRSFTNSRRIWEALALFLLARMMLLLCIIQQRSIST